MEAEKNTEICCHPDIGTECSDNFQTNPSLSELLLPINQLRSQTGTDSKGYLYITKFETIRTIR